MTKFLFVRHGEPDYSSIAEWGTYADGKKPCWIVREW